MVKLNNIKIETNEAYNKVLFFFFSFPDINIGLNELVSNIKISKTSANKIVTKLQKEGFLIKKIVGKNWIIKCNKSHIYNKGKKIAFNLQLIYESNILNEIRKKIPNSEAIVLFGSYRKGDDIEKSDIDIAINIIDKEFKIEELGIIKNFGYRKNVAVNLHLFSKDKIKKNLFSNIANGIVLEGFLEI